MGTPGQAGGGFGTAVSPSVPSPSNTTLLGIATWCQTIISNQDPVVLQALYTHINQSQKDWEMEFADHVALQKSQQLPLTGPDGSGNPQDICYHFTDTAPDFRKERLIRQVIPLNLAHPLQFIEYTQFRLKILDQGLWVPGLPMYWYWAPEDPTGFHVWPLPAVSGYTLQFDYIAYAPELINLTDVPFFDREFHKALGFQALFYYYLSESVNMPDKAQYWNLQFEGEKMRYKKDMQRRQLQLIRLPYGTGVNEGRQGHYPPFFR